MDSITLLFILVTVILALLCVKVVYDMRKRSGTTTPDEQMKRREEELSARFREREELLTAQYGEREQNLTTRLAAAQEEIEHLRNENITLRVGGEGQRAEIEKLREKSEKDKEELEKLQASFRAEFRNLAAEMLEERSKQFKETNKESIEILLKPFRDNITEFRERVEKIFSHSNEQQGALKTELKNLMDLNRRITEETNNLTAALKGNSKVQGDWGEAILETILEGSNLKKGIHYHTQTSIKDDDNNEQRPDVIIDMPEGKRIVVDSKVSLRDFVKYTESETEEERKRCLEAHKKAIRGHVTELGRKSYQNLLDCSPDFVIMFVASEPAFLSAMQDDNTIWSYAYERKVIISSPTNLFAMLKIVDDLWKRDTQNRNAIKIAEEGAKLYDKFVGFVETLESVGKNINAASVSYQKAKDQLVDGRGNLVSRAEKMRKLGVKASKNMPLQLTGMTDESALLPDEADDQEE